MATVTVTTRQQLRDIALQQYGHIKALLWLCIDNDLPADYEPEVGEELQIRTAQFENKLIADYFATNSFNIASKPL